MRNENTPEQIDGDPAANAQHPASEELAVQVNMITVRSCSKSPSSQSLGGGFGGGRRGGSLKERPTND
jgi:hypothetical protein